MPEVTISTPRGVRLAGTFEPPDGPPDGLPDDDGPAVEVPTWRAPEGSAVLFAHGVLTERSSRGRADLMAQHYRRHGFATLAIDFSGCGASGDDVVLVSHEVEDLESASRFLADAGYPRQVLHGHSLGALVALRTATPYVEAMVLTGAVTGPIRHPWEHVLSEDQIAEVRATGTTTVVDDGPSTREQNLISAQTLADFADIDQPALLGAVTCPVLLLHGGALVDGEEHPLLTRSRVGLPLLPEGSVLQVVLGGDHSLIDHTDVVARRALTWLEHVLVPL
jgi:putative redox protein